MFPFAFTVLFFFVCHFGISLPVTETVFIPQAALIPVGLLMLMRRPDLKVVIFSFAVSSALVLWVVALAPSGVVEPIRRLLSGGQFIYMLTICALVAGAKAFSAGEASKAARHLNIISAVIVVFGLLEIFTPLRLISDAFRELVYRGQSYSADLRDLGLAGFVRPKAFASEPSHAAWSICLLVLGSFAFRPSRANCFYGLFILLVSTFIFVSPNTPITAVFLSLAAILVHWDKQRITATLLNVGIVCFGGLLVGAFLIFNMLSYRVDAYSGYETSLYIRLIQPVALAKTALEYNWLVGVGFGGLEAIWNKITLIEGGAGTEFLNRTPAMALLTVPLYAGVSGVIVFIGIVGGIFRKLGKEIGGAVTGVLVFALLQKQSFVITTAWLLAAIWMMQLRDSLGLVRREGAQTSRVTPKDIVHRRPIR